MILLKLLLEIEGSMHANHWLGEKYHAVGTLVVCNNVMKTKQDATHKPFKPDIEVLGRFAEAFYTDISVKKTHMYYASRLRWSLFVEYLNWLRNSNYVQCQINEKDEQYVLTDTGREMFSKLLTFLECIRLQSGKAI